MTIVIEDNLISIANTNKLIIIFNDSSFPILQKIHLFYNHSTSSVNIVDINGTLNFLPKQEKIILHHVEMSIILIKYK